MKIKVAQKDLIYAINILSRATSVRTSIEVLKGFYIETGNNKVIMKGNDLNVYITVELPALVLEEGTALIDSSLFSEIIKKFPDEAVHLGTEQDAFIISCSESTFKLSLMDAQTFPQIPEVAPIAKLSINQSEFSKMIKMTNFAVARDDKSPILTGSLINVKDDNMKMVSIDGYTIAIKNTPISSGDEVRIVVPGSILGDIQKIISYNVDEDIDISISENYALFEFDDVKIISKLLEGEYINYEQVIKIDYSIKCKLNTKEFYRSLDRASLLSRRSREYLVVFEFESDVLTIKSKTSIGMVKETIPIQKEGDNITIGFNPEFLLKALREIDDEHIMMNMSSSISPCSLTPLEGDEFKYFLVPVRITRYDN